MKNIRKRGIVAAFAPLLVLIALFLAAGGIALAQDELTLDGLAEQLAALVSRVDEVESKLTPGAIVDKDGNCRLAVSDRLHPTSLVEYLEKYPDSDTPGRIAITNVYIVPGTGVAVTFGPISESSTYRFVTEYWSGCEFLNTSGWWATDWQGKRIDE